MPAKVKAAHHKGSYDVQSRQVVAKAKADPNARCWKCRRTLAEVTRAKRIAGSRARVYWCAGHVNRAEVNGPLRAECSECSGREGQRITTSRLRAQTVREPITPLTLQRR